MRLLLVFVWALATAASAPAAPHFDLLDTAGAHHTAQEWRNKKAAVVFFTMTDCPISNGYVPEMNRIRADYEKQGVVVYAAHSDPVVADLAVKKHAADFAISFPVLLDHQLALAKLAGANTVPEVAVFSPTGEVLYLGRIDDRALDITRRRDFATQHDLRDALDAIVAGKKPAVTRTKAIGCSINLEGNLEGTK